MAARHNSVLRRVHGLAVHRGYILSHEVALGDHAASDDCRGDGHADAGGFARLARGLAGGIRETLLLLVLPLHCAVPVVLKEDIKINLKKDR